jgi:DNA-directed RNA polymerase
MTDLYERQCEIEYACVLMGEQRYENARQEGGESATPPGQWQTRLCLPVLAEAIRDFMERTRDGGAGRRHTAFPYLLHIEPAQAAYLTIRYVLDAASVGKSFTSIALEVGTAIEDHINVLRLSGDAPALFRMVVEQLKTSTSARHRTAVWRRVFDNAEKNKKNKPLTVERLRWSKADKLALGAALIELMETSTTLIVSVNERKGRKLTRKKVRLTDKAVALLAEAHEKAALFQPVHLPMVVPPRDWKSPFRGGYLTGVIRGARMVQSHSKQYLDELKNVDMPGVYDAINIVQATPWRINRGILDVMLEAHALGVKYQSLFVEADEIPPLRPAHIPEKDKSGKKIPIDKLPLEQREELIAWKRDVADVHEANQRRVGKRAAVGKKLQVAQDFVRDERIYFPHYLDFRGRMYPFASYLNPQADDSGRALLEFADGKALGESGLTWLKVHVANLFGVDKVSFEERVSWVDKNLDKLLACVASPLDNLFWSEADSPWMALAACMELAGALIEGADYVSHLPIAMDGSCSGLQHYSAMLRDPVGGRAVNLVPADKPGDIYTLVAKRAQALVNRSADATAAAWHGDKVVRKIAKQPTMTLCYSATIYGMQGQIKRAIDGLGGDTYLHCGVTAREGAKYLAPVVWDAIGDVVIAARQAMSFLKTLAAVAASDELPIRWTTPLGFPVVQEYREPKAEIVKVMYGGQRIELTINREGTKLDKRRQIAGVAPNYVHSLDAAHLMSTVCLGATNELVDWAVVHDSFGVHAADVDTLHAVLRETFIEQYTPDVLARLRTEVQAQLPADAELPDVPTPGALDLAAVRDSSYFFA